MAMHLDPSTLPLHYLPAREVAARIRAGELSSEAVVRACLDRIGALNPRFNIVVDLHAAAALAAGVCALELGSDAAGSIRVPAHCCGVVAMKTTEGRVSGRGHGHYPGIPFALRHICTFGPLARTVDDVELAMTLLVALDAAFPDAPPVLFAPRPEPRPETLRIAWSDAFGGYPVSEDTAAALRAVAASLRASGARVERRGPEAIGGDDALVTWGEINGFETATGLPAVARRPMSMGAALRFGRGPFSRGLSRGMRFSAPRYFHALDRRDRYCGEFDAFLAGYDAWLCPVAAVPAITHRRTGAAIQVDGTGWSYSMALGAWASMVAVLGVPAVVVPAGLSREGLPIGIQVVGRRWDDAGVLAVARVVERLTGGFRPPPPLAD
jgi:amidase